MKRKMSWSHKGMVPWNKGLKGCFDNGTLKNIRESQRLRYLKNKPSPEKVKEILSLYGKVPRMQIFKLVGVSKRNTVEVLKDLPVIMTDVSRRNMSDAKKGRMPKNLELLHQILRRRHNGK